MKQWMMLAGMLGLVSSGKILAYGPAGHQLVGGIAQHRLEGTPTGAKVSALLDGLTLDRVATLPDEIKGWDAKGPKPLFPDGSHQVIQRDLEAYHAANKTQAPGDGEVLHRSYHYTDVPVEENSYTDGKRGRTDHDIVQLIPFCMQVLSGQASQNNSRKITKRVAVILLAHFLGDLHQPLHVGAEYFDVASQAPVNGDDTTHPSLPDEGGNTITLPAKKPATSTAKGTKPKPPELHGFWDNDTVTEAKRQLGKKFHGDLATQLAATEPEAWKPDFFTRNFSSRNSYARVWADEILPLARQAHTRLHFTAVKANASHTLAQAAVATLPSDYLSWAGSMVADEIHKGGWRLAWVLELSLE